VGLPPRYYWQFSGVGASEIRDIVNHRMCYNTRYIVNWCPVDGYRNGDRCCGPLGFEKVPNFGYTEVLSDSQYL